VTIPYKSEIIRLLDNTEAEAEEIGAVNVIKIKRTGNLIKLIGFNSDVTGIRDTLLPCITENVRNALVLGTGGSSKAVCHVLNNFGLKVDLVSRNRKPGVLSYSDIDAKIIEGTQLIVNTTPLGMFPNIENKPDIDYKKLNSNHILFDLVYNPELTSFLKMGAEQGCRLLSGIKMLHSQAEKAWEIWNSDSF
jgi:shikimate dehydrogenase